MHTTDYLISKIFIAASSVTNNLTRKSFFTIIDTNISIDTEIDVSKIVHVLFLTILKTAIL